MFGGRDYGLLGVMSNAAAEDEGWWQEYYMNFSPVSFMFLVYMTSKLWACSEGYRIIVITQSLIFWHKIYNIELTKKWKKARYEIYKFMFSLNH